MNRIAANGLTLKELEQIEEAAHRSQTPEAKSCAATRSGFEGSAPDKGDCARLGCSVQATRSGHRGAQALKFQRPVGN